MPLKAGTPLLAFARGKWWRATVIAVEEDGKVVVSFPGWDSRMRDRIPRKFLQIDPDPSRSPMQLPASEDMRRWAPPPNPEGIRSPGSDDVQQGADGR
jgi:hypothetical protein